MWNPFQPLIDLKAALWALSAEVHDLSINVIGLRLDNQQRLSTLEAKVSAMHEEFKAAVQRLDAATTAVGARLDKLASEIDGGLSAAEAAPIVTELQALGAKLEAMGKDPVNPDPEPMPDPA